MAALPRPSASPLRVCHSVVAAAAVCKPISCNFARSKLATSERWWYLYLSNGALREGVAHHGLPQATRPDPGRGEQPLLPEGRRGRWRYLFFFKQKTAYEMAT